MGVQWGDNPDRAWAAERRRTKGEDHEGRRHESAAPTPAISERAILIGVGRDQPSEAGNLWMLDELAELAKTAGADVVGRIYQRLDRPHPSSYIGRGKLEELSELAEENEANLVIADSDLSPAQVRTLEAGLDLRVIDRSELIIDIFARHARTRQARLQVELAQLEYLAPRLKRMWTHLSRITGAGGIGSRGPGEKQIEVDRRIIQRRIRDLKHELANIEGRRERQVASRQRVFKVALVGYTNAGKSTLMRALTNSDVFVADQLFATLDTRTRRWKLEGGMEALLSDTVGFVRKLPHHLVASFHATLEEVREAELLLHVVDASDPDAESKVGAVREVLEELGAGTIPELLVINKIDLLADPVELTILSQRLESEVCVSAVRGQGLDRLEESVSARLSKAMHMLDLRVPVADGKTLSLLASVAHVYHRSYEGEFCEVRAAVPPSALGAVERYRVGD